MKRLQRGWCAGVLASATLLGGCVGAHGTHARAVTIDSVLLAVGAGSLAIAFSSRGDSVWGFGFLGITTGVAGAGGLLLTAISKLGETSRDSHDPPPVFAVRPFTPRTERAPFDPGTLTGRERELATTALTEARSQKCDEALDAVDQLWSPTGMHAALVRDPAIAACIDKGLAQ